MLKLGLPLGLLVISYALFFGYVSASYGQLPMKVASHFDFYGHPDGWMSREACVGIMVAVAIFVPAIVIACMGCASWIPVSFINLPHRDYWLATERRQGALAALLRYSIWFAALNVLFMTGMQWLIVDANLHGNHLNLTDLAFLMTGFLATTAIWTALLVRHFLKLG